MKRSSLQRTSGLSRKPITEAQRKARSANARKLNASRTYEKAGKTIRCLQCGEEFYVSPGSFTRKFCSQKCMGLHNLKGRCVVCGAPCQSRHRTCRSAACLKELRGARWRGPENPARKQSADSGSNHQAWLRWRASVKKTCAICGTRKGIIELHHVVYKQHVTREGGDIHDPRNGLTLCRRCHSRHHLAVAVIHQDFLSLANWEFAEELFRSEDMARLYFDRYYMSWEEAKTAEEFSTEVLGSPTYPERNYGSPQDIAEYFRRYYRDAP